jgi:hypothetical protein
VKGNTGAYTFTRGAASQGYRVLLSATNPAAITAGFENIT